jgi:hypothetical protein
MATNKVIFKNSEFDLSKPIKGAFINKSGDINIKLINSNSASKNNSNKSKTKV